MEDEVYSEINKPIVHPFEHQKDCNLIQLNDVSKIYKTGAGEFVALKDINLCFGEGEYVSVMGKSGSGKSTLINMITGIDHPSAGSVQIGGVDVHHMGESKLAAWRGRTLGVVFQFFQLLPMLSVLENTLLPMDFCNKYGPGERVKRAMELLEMLGLSDIADQSPSTLSGGQLQIAAIARALANDPPIIVGDEPTGNLDSRTAEKVLEIFANLAKIGKTIIIVTHDPGLARRTHRQLLLSDGELVDERISRSLPMLTHQQMLQVSRRVETHNFEPGVEISSNGSGVPGLHVIVKGQVDVLVNGNGSSGELLGRVPAGAYFSELDLPDEVDCHLSLRASSHESVQVLWLNREDFFQLISDAHDSKGGSLFETFDRKERFPNFISKDSEDWYHVPSKMV